MSHKQRVLILAFYSFEHVLVPLRFASARCLEIVCGTITTPTSARIVERVTVGSPSACHTILRTSLPVVILVAPNPVFRAWVPSRVHCSQQFLTAHSERSTNTARRPACSFHPDDQDSLKLA
ncbi:uncharacterized protein TNCV_2560001 [Trichonephila clavipes]|nr:uncharacterized protein TNCV_2560001 [Trichonephila clavipes]